MKRILVIGSNSFSGASFVRRLLEKENKVIGVSRSNELNNVFLPYSWDKNLQRNFKFVKIDINHDLKKFSKLISEFKPEYIINFAAQGMVAQSWLSPEDWYQTNVVGQVKLHNILKDFDFIDKYIHVTTPEVYGSTDGWVEESLDFRPSTPYAVSRAACDLHLMSFLKAYNFPVVFTRAANVYGEGQQLYRIIPRTLLFARTNNKLHLHGGGKSVRSFIHIDDVSDATMKIASNGKIGETYHISTNETISIKDLVSMICDLCKKDFEELVEITDDRLGKDQSYLLNSNKLRNSLNWSEEISLQNGILRTLDWIDSNIQLLQSLPQEYVHKK